MPISITCAPEAGFCWGVNRAVTLLEKVAPRDKLIYSLGAVVHNKQVLGHLAEIGVTVADNLDEVKGDTVVISTHGVSPQVKEDINSLGLKVIDTTCPFVKRAQTCARRLYESGFYSIVFGDKSHPEVRAILGWAGGYGSALTEAREIRTLPRIPRRLGILSQTTQVPSQFLSFTQELIALVWGKDSEIRMVDTICHDIRKRQQSALEIASRSQLMLVIGGHNSANTRHLATVCSELTETHQIETADEVRPEWLRGCSRVGVTSGASTPSTTIERVLKKIKELS